MSFLVVYDDRTTGPQTEIIVPADRFLIDPHGNLIFCDFDEDNKGKTAKCAYATGVWVSVREVPHDRP